MSSDSKFENDDERLQERVKVTKKEKVLKQVTSSFSVLTQWCSPDTKPSKKKKIKR